MLYTCFVPEGYSQLGSIRTQRSAIRSHLLRRNYTNKALSPGLFLHREQLFLALDAPTIATWFAILAHHAVAGDRYRYGVGRAGSGYGSCGFGDADVFCFGACGSVLSSAHPFTWLHE